jgi:hypothetical protein
MDERFPDADCPRCQTRTQLYTVPLRLIPPTAGESWQALCGECFRSVLETEPSNDLLMVPIHRGRRNRR